MRRCPSQYAERRHLELWFTVVKSLTALLLCGLISLKVFPVVIREIAIGGDALTLLDPGLDCWEAARRARARSSRLESRTSRFTTCGIPSHPVSTAAGVSTLTVAQMLGHSSTQIVPRYAQVLDQNRIDAIRKLEGLKDSTTNPQASPTAKQAEPDSPTEGARQ
jgi:hypothetical protein